MANIKQQKKRIKTNEKARLRNSSVKSAMKTAMKSVFTAVDQKDKNAASTALANAYKRLDKAQAKGVVHKNYVARHKSNLAEMVNTI